MKKILLFLLTFCVSAQAETLIPRNKKPVRRFASIESIPTQAETRVKVRRKIRTHPEYELQLGLMGGLSSLKSSEEEVQTARETEKITSNFYLGVNADFRAMTYFGVELDGYYGIAPAQTLSDGAGGEEETVSLRQYGALFNLKAQYPFLLGHMKLIPKAGLGYGLMGLKHSASLGEETTETSEKLSGIYGVIGIEAHPMAQLVLFMDYARSLKASGSYSISGSISEETDLEDSGFHRFRIGGYYRVIEHLNLGAQFALRGMAATFPASLSTDSGSSPSPGETHTQFLVLVMYEL